MNRDEMLTLLSEFIATHSPPGEEAEIEPIIQREFASTSAKIWQDSATNIYAHFPGDGPKVMVCAHKDEIGMVVTDVLANGRLKVKNCGGSYAWKYGEGPIDVLGSDGEILRGILSVGSTHTSTGPVAEIATSRPLKWEDVTVFTGLTPDALAEQGIHVGSRAIVARERKQIQVVGDMIASYALDDRMGLVSMIGAMKELDGETLPIDLYFVACTSEEVGLVGALRAAQLLQPDVCVALDTSPVVHGTPGVLDARPIIWYKEAVFHNKSECDTVLRLANELGFGAQPIIYDGAASDAGGVKRAGLAGRTVAFGFPRDNSHGYEIAHPDSLVNVKDLLVAYLKQLS